MTASPTALPQARSMPCTHRGPPSYRGKMSRHTLRITQRDRIHYPTLPRARGTGDEGAWDAARNASPVPENVTPEDFNLFMSLLQSETPEEVEQKAVVMARAGDLTEGVVEAGFATLQQAKEREGTDERVIASLQGLCNYLLELYGQITNTPGALKLVDEFVQLMKPDQEDSVNEEAVREAMRRTLLADDSESDGVAEFIASVEGFLVSMRAQDIEFEAQYKALIEEGTMSPEQQEQLDQIQELRRAAVMQMETVKEIAGTL